LNNFGRGPVRHIPVAFGQIPISGSKEKVVLSFPYIIQCKIVTCSLMKAPGLVVLDKLNFENIILKTYFLIP